jgi:hypothetical protein
MRGNADQCLFAALVDLHWSGVHFRSRMDRVSEGHLYSADAFGGANAL